MSAVVNQTHYSVEEYLVLERKKALMRSIA